MDEIDKEAKKEREIKNKEEQKRKDDLKEIQNYKIQYDNYKKDLNKVYKKEESFETIPPIIDKMNLLIDTYNKSDKKEEIDKVINIKDVEDTIKKSNETIDKINIKIEDIYKAMNKFKKYIINFIKSKEEDNNYNIEKYDKNEENAQKIYDAEKQNINNKDYIKIDDIWSDIKYLIENDLKEKYNSYIDIREKKETEKKEAAATKISSLGKMYIQKKQFKQ
jgi:hypothetical protein